MARTDHRENARVRWYRMDGQIITEHRDCPLETMESQKTATWFRHEQKAMTDATQTPRPVIVHWLQWRPAWHHSDCFTGVRMDNTNPVRNFQQSILVTAPCWNPNQKEGICLARLTPAVCKLVRKSCLSWCTTLNFSGTPFTKASTHQSYWISQSTIACLWKLASL